MVIKSGEPQQKLEYAFTLYDADGNGTLDNNEVRAVLSAMLDLLGKNLSKYLSQMIIIDGDKFYYYYRS